MTEESAAFSDSTLLLSVTFYEKQYFHIRNFSDLPLRLTD